MKPRGIAGLLIAGVVVIAIALILSYRRDGNSGETQDGQAVLPDLKASVNDVTEIRMTKPGGTTTVLKKRESDWAVADRGFPADSGQVRKLLLDLSALRVIEEKTSDPESYSKLGVEDVSAPGATSTQVELVGPKKTHKILIGKSSGVKSSYFRMAGAKQSVLASPQIHVDADPKRWLDRTVIDLPESRVKEVAVTAPSGPSYTVSREKKEQTDFTVSNIPKGRELSGPSAANPIAGALASLSLDDVRKASTDSSDAAAAAGSAPAPKDAKASKDSKPATARATYKTFDGLTVEVTGRQDGDDRLLKIAAQSTAKETEAEAQKINSRLTGWEIEIPSYKYDAIFKPLDGLLAEKQGEKKK